MLSFGSTYEMVISLLMPIGERCEDDIPNTTVSRVKISIESVLLERWDLYDILRGCSKKKAH